MKLATTIDQQIELLVKRGMSVDDYDKAKEILLDIGYYRLGFYCFPFEKGSLGGLDRTHEYVEGTNFRDIVDLYYFDCQLRDILLTALHRIEVNFRTRVVYFASNAFLDSPTWFVDSRYVDKNYASEFNTKVYESLKCMSSAEVIRKHHAKYINDRYAPAWKTLEFMTFGAIIRLYRSIINDSVKSKIAETYSIESLSVMLNYIQTVHNLRNLCAHSSVLFDASLDKRISRGPAKGMSSLNNSSIFGAIRITSYLLAQISCDRGVEFDKNVSVLLEESKRRYPKVLSKFF